jgi:hypothetical protein
MCSVLQAVSVEIMEVKGTAVITNYSSNLAAEVIADPVGL